VFEIVVAVEVQSAFRLEIYQNNFFLFFKNYFKCQFENIKKIKIHGKFFYSKFEGIHPLCDT
jgi:hypothetical protein